MYGIKEKITREYILSRISEEDIFHKYLSIIPNTIDYFCNPMRTDSHADCRFYRDGSRRLKFNDFAYKVNLDCFNVVEKLYQCNYYQAMDIVVKDFNLLGSEVNMQVIADLEKELKTARAKGELRVMRKEFTPRELEWWKSEGLHKETLDIFNCASLQNVWYNGNLIYSYKKHDPGFVYHLKEGTYNYKCYFPTREKYRFLQNVNDCLQGYEQLPESGDFLIVGKSLKDVMNKYQYQIPSVAPMAEGCELTDEQYADLSERFFHIFSLFDRDRAGMIGAQKMRKRFGIKPILFGDPLFRKKSEPKDFTDHHVKYGASYMLDLIEEAKYNLL